MCDGHAGAAGGTKRECVYHGDDLCAQGFDSGLEIADVGVDGGGGGWLEGVGAGVGGWAGERGLCCVVAGVVYHGEFWTARVQ